ncbi:mannan-binding lectin [Shewanella baltica]|uniref:mannan-binding lectin n=1 Tax=Shewanella baltica TaxID=62322 RepID=UPI00217EEFD3|nr:mannan-binding lectin [Shewanella baltica]MCS6122809.1 mannan-binding protein [Shewanella baltica]MCS6234491.1 mannan-binding protein [Shewanella baltica]MCS6268866.1 mannan-binding protein [Shewanella baltica]MDR9764688.1 mannan-binding lectin [Shewanella baltica]
MRTITVLSIAGTLFAVCTLSASANQDYPSVSAKCPVEESWLTSPSLPQEVKTSASDGSSTFCDFYQFSTQTFLYLMSQGKSGLRNYQDEANYPVLEFNDDGSPANSCDREITGKVLRTHLLKTAGASSITTGQAGGGATIYAQDGNVVYYSVRFSKALCDLSSSAVELQKQNITNFPAGSMELKLGWKVLSSAEIASNSFVTQEQMVANKKVTLGLAGMHLVTATANHPEFIWSTYEHKTNTPDCTPATPQTGTDWTFASATCTAGLPDTAAKGNTCNFNSPLKNQTSPTGVPTNICRVYPDGTSPDDLKAGENVADITAQNTGLLALLAQPSTPAGMKVLSNYFTVGALWVSDTGKNSGGVGVPNERGSLRLANSVAETDYQHVDLTSTFASNCFGCHNYIGNSQTVSNNITSQALSHIFKDIKIGQGQSIDVNSPDTINSQNAASTICQSGPTSTSQVGVCPSTASYLTWNGQWTNSNASAGSVCGCVSK